MEEHISDDKSYEVRRLNELIKKCNPGDFIYAASTDRIGRNFMDIMKLMDEAKKRSVTFVGLLVVLRCSFYSFRAKQYRTKYQTLQYIALDTALLLALVVALDTALATHRNYLHHISLRALDAALSVALMTTLYLELALYNSSRRLLSRHHQHNLHASKPRRSV